MHTQRLTRPCLMLLAMLLAMPSFAQPLIDQVPSEAALYVGWRGANDMGPDYEGSNMQGVIEQTGLLEALPQLVDALRTLGEADEMEPEVGELLSMGGTLWASIWANGGAMYMLPPEAAGPPVPRLAVMWNKGDDEPQVREALSKLVEMINDQGQMPAFMGNAGDAVFLSIGFDAGELAAADALGDTDRYKQAAQQVQGDGALVVYIDVQEWIAQVDAFVEQMAAQAQEWDEPADPFTQMWPTLRDASGLSGAHRLMMSAGLAGKDWQTKLYLDAPAPRTGILSLIDTKPITPANLTHVPKTATYLQVFTLDPARVLEVTRDILTAVDPNMVEQMDDALAEGSEVVGVDLERELINGMGPVWSMYIDPMVAGNGFSSLVMVNELRNPDAVEKALEKLSEAANEAMADAIDDAPFNIRLLTREVNGGKITHLGIPYIAPAYMIHDGRLYVSLFPQGLEMAMEQTGEAQDSILANDAFAATMDRFGDRPFTGMSFTDLPETAPDGYGINLMIVQTIAGAGEMMGGKPSPMRMPPIGKLMPFIEPAGAVTWVDDAGLHMHSIEPFPGSALLGPAKGMESTLAVSGPMAVGIMLPALGSARQAAQEAQAMSNLRQLTVAAMIYSADHDDAMPQDLAQLREYVDDDELFFSPRALRDEPMPFNFGEWEADRQDRYLRENSSFVLVPVGNMDELVRGHETVLIFERRIGDGPVFDGVLVGWADGSVTTEFDTEWLAEQIEEQTGKTVEQLIERQEKFGQ